MILLNILMAGCNISSDDLIAGPFGECINAFMRNRLTRVVMADLKLINCIERIGTRVKECALTLL